jgi:hypothetical protein
MGLRIRCSSASKPLRRSSSPPWRSCFSVAAGSCTWPGAGLRELPFAGGPRLSQPPRHRGLRDRAAKARLGDLRPGRGHGARGRQVALGVHFPADLLAAAAVGGVSALVLWWAPLRAGINALADSLGRRPDRLARRRRGPARPPLAHLTSGLERRQRFRRSEVSFSCPSHLPRRPSITQPNEKGK